MIDSHDVALNKRLEMDSDDSENDQEVNIADSSDDEFGLMKIGRKNVPRHRYKTVDAESDGSSSCDIDDNNLSKRKHRRQRRKDDDIYGVFGESDDDERHGQSSLPTKKRQRNEQLLNMGVNAPMFVKGKIEDVVDDDYKKMAEHIETADHDSVSKTSKHESGVKNEKNNNLDETDAKSKMREEEANQRFLALIEEGRTNRKGRKVKDNAFTSETRMDNSLQPNYEENEVPNSIGLGFGAMATKNNRMNEIVSGSSESLPTQFGKIERPRRTSAVLHKDPDLGKWEKHTKGIGMKLLSKMGYKGSGGLGVKRASNDFNNLHNTNSTHVSSGIDRPIEVKVRPTSLGLGFGNFQEATRLKSNQAIESKVHGTRVEGSSSSDTMTNFLPSQKSMLPTNSDLLTEKLWKKGSKTLKQSKRKFIQYTELLEEMRENSSAIPIIDMRGPQTGEKNDTNTIRTGDELLHNLSILLSTYEAKILSTNQMIESNKRKQASLQSDLTGICNRQQVITNRIEQLRRVHITLDEIERIISSADYNNENNMSKLMHVVLRKIKELGLLFTDDERQSLQFSTSMVPALLEPIIQARLNKWNPVNDKLSISIQVVKFVLLIDDDDDDLTENAAKTMLTDMSIDIVDLRRILFTDFLLHKLIRALESSRWNPISDVEAALQLYESIQLILEHHFVVQDANVDHEGTKALNESVFSSSTSIETNISVSQELLRRMRKVVVHKVVFARLIASIKQWKPKLIRKKVRDNELFYDLEDRIDLWILPWIPYLSDDKDLTSQLVADCKRQVKISVMYLQKTILQNNYHSNDESNPVLDFVNAAIVVLRPWRGILKIDSIQTIFVDLVVPQLALFISTRITTSSVFGTNHNGESSIWYDFDTLFKAHKFGLLSDLEFLSIVEGEILTPWALVVHTFLTENPPSEENLMTVALKYKQCKLHVLLGRTSQTDKLDTGTDVANGNNEYATSVRTLQGDNRICSCFFAVLLMIIASQEQQQKESQSTNSELSFEKQRPPTDRNYRVVLAIRKSEMKQDTADDLLRMNESGIGGERRTDATIEARVRLNRSATSSAPPPFRDVVAEFAREQNILFHPRIGSNAYKDGKQIFLFGTIPIYLDGTVAFGLRNGKWNPMSLEDLAKLAAK